jgi:hypothetical protein
MILVFIFTFFLYAYLEFFFRKRLCPEPKCLPSLPRWQVGKEWTFFISPGYWVARLIKNRISFFPPYQRMHARRHLVWNSNIFNVYFSCFITTLVFIQFYVWQNSVSFLTALATIRFVSRTFEIIYAFGNDVVSRQQNKSGLHKQTRIRLALKSYFELYIIAIPVYFLYGGCMTIGKAVIMSMSVGSLTNVGMAVSEKNDLLSIFAFSQVLATLSLVVLSLAMYLSRKN